MSSPQDVRAGGTAVPTVQSANAGQPDERSLGEIVSDIAGDLSTLVRQEMDLAKTEVKHEASRAGRGIGLLGGAGVAGLPDADLPSLALTYLLDNWMPVELAALIVAGIWLSIAAVLGLSEQERPQAGQPAAAADAAFTEGGRTMGQTTDELNTRDRRHSTGAVGRPRCLAGKVSPSAIVERRRAAAKGRLQSIKSRVMGSADSATSSVGDAAGSVRGTAQGAVRSAEEYAQGSPLAAGVVAFGAGMLISALLPATDVESRASQKVVDAAKEHGQPVVDEAKSVGQDMAGHLKETATQAAQEVKDSAQESAAKVQDEGQTAGEHIKSESSRSSTQS